MNVPEFTSLLQHPGKISGDQMYSLLKIVQEYPYFQPVRALYLKALKQQDSFEYNTALKHTAAYTTDRTILFDFITSETFLQHQTAKHINKRIFDINTIEVTAEEFVVETLNKEENEAILNPGLFYPKAPDPDIEDSPLEEELPAEKDGTAEEKTIPEEKEPEAQLEMGKPLSFDPHEMHSFAEWLKLTALKPIDRSTGTDHVSETKKKRTAKFKLIDKFIAQNPKIVPKKDAAPSPDIIREKEVEKADLMTATLARVYLEQKKFKKAIQAYKILSLKYPEKSSFFADQIKAIQDLQQNNN